MYEPADDQAKHISDVDAEVRALDVERLEFANVGRN